MTFIIGKAEEAITSIDHTVYSVWGLKEWNMERVIKPGELGEIGIIFVMQSVGFFMSL